MPQIQLSQISLFTAIVSEITRQSGKKAAGSARQLNAVADAATAIVRAFATEDVPSKAGMGLAAWLASDDTGSSSRAMAHHLMGARLPPRWNTPHDASRHPLDPDDFGRCHRFLESVPEARAKLPEMNKVSEVWSRLVAHWDELTTLYLAELPTGKAPKLYDKMKELGC